MSVIAVVDDRVQMRESVADKIKLGLEDMGIDWNVIADEPLESIEGYPSWIADNDISLLILDERLGEEIGSSGVAVSYSGHEVAAVLRKQLPELPQLIITSVKNSEELEGAAGLDAIVQRDEFDKHARVHIERMVRLVTRFVDRNEAELAELTTISQKIVDGAATDDDVTRLNAIREKVQMGVRGEEIGVLRQVLTEAEVVKQRLQQVLDKLNEKLQQ